MPQDKPQKQKAARKPPSLTYPKQNPEAPSVSGVIDKSISECKGENAGFLKVFFKPLFDAVNLALNSQFSQMQFIHIPKFWRCRINLECQT